MNFQKKIKDKSKTKMSAEEFDKLADSGESLDGHIDWSKAVKIINVSLPIWMIKGLDAEANRLNIDRQAVIKTWLAEKLDGKVFAKSKAV
jgi:hypothetical protein